MRFVFTKEPLLSGKFMASGVKVGSRLQWSWVQGLGFKVLGWARVEFFALGLHADACPNSVRVGCGWGVWIVGLQKIKPFFNG